MIARVRSNSTWIALLMASSLAGSACAPDDSDSAGDGEPSADADGDAAGADDANPGDAGDRDGTDGGTTDTEGPDDDGTDGATDTEGTEDADPADVSPGTDTGSDTGSTLRCDLPAMVDTEVVVDTGCAPLASDGVRVASTGRLVLQPGVTVAFSTGAVLQVDGGGELVAQGTAEDMVTLQGAVAEAGTWRGIYARYSGTTGSTVRLSHTVVQHGGFEDFEAMACLTSLSGVSARNTIAITDTTFADCAFLGVVVLSPNSDFEAFDRVTITRADTALSLHPDVIGSLPAQVAIDDNAVLQVRPGTLSHTQTWQPQRSPWRVDGEVAVGSTNSGPAPLLTLAPGVELLFVADSDMLVGASPGGLVANDVRFAAQEGGGRWGGIRFLESTTESNLNNVQVSGTGTGPFGGFMGAGILLRETGDRVSITNSEFVDNVVDIFVDCASTPVLTGNMATVVNDTGC
jgi:hypothetical protein